jgi:MarR family transcriptional repressor of emrRAB
MHRLDALANLNAGTKCLSSNDSRRYITPMKPSVFVFERLAALLQQLVREDAARHGLLPVHLQVLGYLAQANRYSNIPIAVASYLGITRGTVSQTLAMLERKGLISRSNDDRHGRRVHLQLTAAGEEVLAGSWPQRLDVLLAAGGVDLDELASQLRAVLGSLQRLNDRQAFGQCRECAHFLEERGIHRCGLTGETLAVDQTIRICREWSDPRADRPTPPAPTRTP